MARRFNGTSDYIVFTLSSALQSLDAGPMTMAICVKMNDTTDGAFIHTRTSGGTNSWWMEAAAGNWNYGMGVAARDVGDLSTGDNWVVLIGRKADGGANAPRGRKIVLGGSTTDVTAGSGLADGTAPGVGGILQVGRWGTASEYIGADIAAVAVWGSDLSDGQTATMTTYQAWLDLSPAWIVAFDQANAGDAIDDDSTTGTGDSSSITGTTIVADPAGFFAGGTGATASPAATVTVVGLPAATIAAGSTPTPAVTTTAVSLPAATVSASSTRTPAATAAVVAVPAAAVSAGATVTPGVIACTVALPAATVNTAGNAAVTPNPIAAVAQLPALALSAAATVAPNRIAALVTLPLAVFEQAAVKATSTDAVLAYNTSTDMVVARNSSADTVTARNSSSGGVT